MVACHFKMNESSVRTHFFLKRICEAVACCGYTSRHENVVLL